MAASRSGFIAPTWVLARRGELDHGPRFDEPRIVIDRYAGEFEVL
jgi:hypothetical protein